MCAPQTAHETAECVVYCSSYDSIVHIFFNLILDTFVFLHTPIYMRLLKFLPRTLVTKIPSTFALIETSPRFFRFSTYGDLHTLI
jgi:hypothetical protein